MAGDDILVVPESTGSRIIFRIRGLDISSMETAVSNQRRRFVMINNSWGMIPMVSRW